MIKRALLAVAAAGLLGSPAFAASKPKAQVLKAGEYAATAKALVCEGCAGQIEKALKGFPGIEAVTVAQQEGKVRFKVKKGAMVKLDELQAALKAESDKMGMGADYSLRDVKREPAHKE